MKQFIHRTRIDAPIASVAEFHRDTKALKRLTMPPIIVQLHRIEPLAEGSEAVFTLWLGPLPVRWLAMHSQVDALRGFTDTQENGPFQTWIHRHRFVELDDKTTEIQDTIQVEMSKHPFWFWVCWFMWLGLPVLFAYRGWVIQRALKGS